MLGIRGKLPVVRHVQNLLLGTDRNLLENPLACMLADMMPSHDALRLLDVSRKIVRELALDLPRDE